MSSDKKGKHEEYLNPSYFCDSNNQELITKAEEITKFDESPKEAALSIFQFVRDHIKFILDGLTKASETLQRGSGDCGNKANLQVALLRAIDVPARFHVASISKEFFKGVLSNSVYDLIPDVIKNHPWCECYYSNKWISCDTLFDMPLMIGLYNRKILTKDAVPTIEWDGFHDLNVAAAWMIEDKGSIHSLEELIPELEEESYDATLETEEFLFSKLSSRFETLRN